MSGKAISRTEHQDSRLYPRAAVIGVCSVIELSKGITVPWAPKNVKLHVNDPEIGEKVSDYQKLFSEIFGGK